MLSIPYLCVYLMCGLCCVRLLLPGHKPLTRIWLGCCLGLLMMMWLPALCALWLDFTVKAHLVALIPLAGLTGVCFLARDRRPVRGFDADEYRQLRQCLWVCVPLTLFSAYLQYTHSLRVDQAGAYTVGQSTYGDLPMHTAFITAMKNAKFPPEYPFFPGERLSYPFLTDSLSTSFYLFGLSLQASLVLPGTLMMALCYFGVMLLAREMTAGRKTVVLAALLFFLNGGLGFLYDFDQAGGVSGGTLTVWQRVENILTGYYKTPTNQPQPNNLRWSNLIADLLIPQRTLLGGYCMVIPCLYLLYMVFDPRRRGEYGGLRPLLLLGVWGGALPLIHTHSFLALGLCSLGIMIYDLIRDKERWRQLRRYLLYGVLAVAVALPQLFNFTFHQALGGRGLEGLADMLFHPENSSGKSFLAFQFNWVNNPGGSGMRDLYLWFYIKNIGLPVIGLLLALFEKNPRHRRLFAGAFAIILAAELIRFQPNEYDNNKLFYLAWLICCMIVADYAAAWWHRLRGLRSRPVMAAGAAVVLFLSAGLTLWREAVSTYWAFSPGAVEAGDYIRDNTEEHATFITGTQHLCPVDSIAGRTIVCGPDLWLYFHGFDTSERKADIADFYTDPAGHLDVLSRYDVDYIYLSSYERSSYVIDRETFDSLFEAVFENGEAVIYRVPEG